MQRQLSPKDMEIIVNDFNSKINGNKDEAQTLLLNAFRDRFEESGLDYFSVGRFECYLSYNSNEYISKPKGFYINFTDNKKIMNSFNKSLSEFLRHYFNPEGYYILEAIAFQLQ